MRVVMIESPFRGADIEEQYENVLYARRAMKDCLMRGEAPLASHLLYTQPNVLNDGDNIERALGIAAGHAWMKVADACVVYSDRGISAGMIEGIEAATAAGILVEYRKLDN